MYLSQQIIIGTVDMALLYFGLATSDGDLKIIVDPIMGSQNQVEVSRS